MRVSTDGFDQDAIDNAVRLMHVPNADLTLGQFVVAAIRAACSLSFEEGLDLEQALARQVLVARALSPALTGVRDVPVIARSPGQARS